MLGADKVLPFAEGSSFSGNPPGKAVMKKSASRASSAPSKAPRKPLPARHSNLIRDAEYWMREIDGQSGFRQLACAEQLETMAFHIRMHVSFLTTNHN